MRAKKESITRKEKDKAGKIEQLLFYRFSAKTLLVKNSFLDTLLSRYTVLSSGPCG